MSFVFRDAHGSDFDFLLKFYSRPYHTREFARKLVELYLNYYFVKVVEVDADIIGLLVWLPRETPKLGWAEILDLWIDEKYRKRGLALKLLKKTIEDIKSYYQSQGHKARHVILFASENNIPAGKLYEKAGFKKVGYGGYRSGNGTKELLYALNLTEE